jgi:UTP-glucose-1-phosphate uridylyltransferase
MVDKDFSCNYEYAWGALTFSKKITQFLDSTDPHLGYGVKNALMNSQSVTARKISGEYFDCGTPSEYLNLLPKVLS